MNKKILCVDDDSNILNGYKRALRKDFEIFTAEGGKDALMLIEDLGEFAVVVSDMRMPEMDGVQFLSRVKEISPNSVRMMLTGNADQQTAIDAVNQGNIFRFLNKPCEPEQFSLALKAGLEQYRLITAEKQLLSETLNQSLQVMIEILSMINPTAFSRSNRIKRLARNIAYHLGIEDLWEIEIAALLSQIGCITVPEGILQKVSRCEPLNATELQLYYNYPQVGRDLISRIPRMESISQMIANQNRRFNDNVDNQQRTDDADEVLFKARVLKVVLDFDKLLETGNLPHQAFRELAERVGWYDQIILNALKEIINESSEEYISTKISVYELKPGMILAESLYSTNNTLLLSEGQEITLPIMLKLLNLVETSALADFIQVSVPLSNFKIEYLEDESALMAA